MKREIQTRILSSVGRLLRRLLRNERGAALIALTIYFPFFVGITTLAVDMSYVLWVRNKLQAAAEAAALAATYKLPDNSACTIADGSAPNSAVQYTGSCDLAKVYVDRNLPVSRYGTVLRAADVVVGKWTDGCAAGGENCFEPGPAPGGLCINYSFPSGTANCNAVKVTTRMAAANGNPLSLTLAQTFGFGSFDVSATAIAVFGLGPNGAAPTWNVVIVQDITRSLAQSELTKMKQANRLLLDCMHQYASPGSKMGVTLFAGCSGPNCLVNPSIPTYQEPVDVSAYGQGYATVRDNIGDPPTNQNAGIKLCNSSGETPGMPLCTFNGAYTGYHPTLGIENYSPGSNFGITTNQYYGMKSAFSQLCPDESGGRCQYSGDPPGSRRAMIIVSDGLPQAANCGNLNSGQGRCDGGTNANGSIRPNLEGDAQKKAQEAYEKGDIDIFTIFYSSASQTSQNYIQGANFMRSLRRGRGLEFDLTTPNADQLQEFMSKICATMPHRLVW
ncbi:MAG TPA: pilus assembly protein TadG-related protein [Xanthobacteraceae bacterium]|nr:pilus assembly protein TadG-related protein [Xanthobacteraceae bacterium]